MPIFDDRHDPAHLTDKFARLDAALRDAALTESQRAEIAEFDIVLRRHLRSQEMLLTRYEFLFEAAPDPYVVTDADGVISEVNEAGRAMLGIDDRIAPPVELVHFIARDERDRYHGWLSQLQAGAPWARWDTRLEIEGRDKPIPVEINLADDLDGIGFRWVLRDQRERVAAENQLRSVAEREHRAADALRAEAKVNSRFLVSLSHDLRGPIGALLHQAELSTMEDLDPEVRQRSRAAMEDNARLLAQLLEALVDVERYALGEFELRRTVAPLADLVDSVRHRDGDDGTHTAPIDPTLLADINLDTMRRAVLTTVNALEGSDGGTVDISARRAGDDVELTLSSAADRFSVNHERVDMRLARALVEMHGGTLRYDRSTTAQTVTITLPAAAPESTP